METRQRVKKKSDLQLFVTIGTTHFDSLMRKLCEPATVQVLQKLGFTKLLLQIGNGEFIPELGDSDSKSVQLEYFRFKPSLNEEFQAADLVISHAGAGTCLAALGAGKKLLVVVNEELMDNHQLELAYQLYKDGYLYYCTCKTLSETLQKEVFSTLKPFPESKPEVFASFLDSVMGFT